MLNLEREVLKTRIEKHRDGSRNLQGDGRQNPSSSTQQVLEIVFYQAEFQKADAVDTDHLLEVMVKARELINELHEIREALIQSDRVVQTALDMQMGRGNGGWRAGGDV